MLEKNKSTAERIKCTLKISLFKDFNFPWLEVKFPDPEEFFFAPDHFLTCGNHVELVIT